MDELLTKGDVAKLLGVTPATVILLEAKGRLSSRRTLGGIRLFERSEVESLAQKRREAKLVQDDDRA